MHQANLGDKPAAVGDVSEYLTAEGGHLCSFMGFREGNESG